MSKIEIIIRKIKRFFGKEYCKIDSRNTHDFVETYNNRRGGYNRLIFYKCKVCGKKVYIDFTGSFTEI